MNIFATNQCPQKSAQVLPDKHIVKMPLECCQMSLSFFQNGIMIGVLFLKKTGDIMKLRKEHFAIIHQPNGQQKTFTTLLG